MGQKIQTIMIREILRLVEQNGESLRSCSKLLNVGKTTVSEYVNRFRQSSLTLSDLDRLSDADLDAYLTKGGRLQNLTQRTLNEYFPHVDKELKRTGVTLFLLWETYKQTHTDGISYSRFCHYYRLWQSGRDVSMRQHYKAGEKLFVDYTGKKLQVADRETGEITDVEVFVAVLGCSHYTYAEAVPSQKKADFIGSNIRMLEFFGGVPGAIVPDCLKSAVTKADRYEPEVNSSYYDFSKHYGTTILPARALKPKDKSLVENMVKTLYTRIFAPIRDMVFFSLDELNDQIFMLLKAHNEKQFQQKETSRKSLFEEVEKTALKPLPASAYQLREFHTAKVAYNHHVYLREDKHYYSVPWEYTGKSVQLVYSQSFMEIYSGNDRIACHKRSFQSYGYSTEASHRPENHRFHEEFGHDRICSWAADIGTETSAYINKLIESRTHPEQAYNSCLGILKTAKKHGNSNLEKACFMGNRLRSYSAKFITNTLKSGTYRFFEEQTEEESNVVSIHRNVRGKENYQ